MRWRGGVPYFHYCSQSEKHIVLLPRSTTQRLRQSWDRRTSTQNIAREIQTPLASTEILAGCPRWNVTLDSPASMRNVKPLRRGPQKSPKQCHASAARPDRTALHPFFPIAWWEKEILMSFWERSCTTQPRFQYEASASHHPELQHNMLHSMLRRLRSRT